MPRQQQATRHTGLCRLCPSGQQPHWCDTKPCRQQHWRCSCQPHTSSGYHPFFYSCSLYSCALNRRRHRDKHCCQQQQQQHGSYHRCLRCWRGVGTGGCVGWLPAVSPEAAQTAAAGAPAAWTACWQVVLKGGRRGRRCASSEAAKAHRHGARQDGGRRPVCCQPRPATPIGGGWRCSCTPAAPAAVGGGGHLYGSSGAAAAVCTRVSCGAHALAKVCRWVAAQHESCLLTTISHTYRHSLPNTPSCSSSSPHAIFVLGSPWLSMQARTPARRQGCAAHCGSARQRAVRATELGGHQMRRRRRREAASTVWPGVGADMDNRHAHLWVGG